ncbi:DMT family transporter [Sutcliffiella cohnii]|uniref:DMT family transporter n=1 Tax=Sutcliffiella sp. NC1 TaxID=3004096 RepID=UPI0022DE5DD7|nr:EamA family transporter [Sutcliffiella sp. NC1]WBL13761.1 EamA family transporter [Sutcliffiella sp. NC1]
MLRIKGILMIISGATLWGATGPLIEYILQNTNLSVPFLLTLRLTIAGLVLLSLLCIKKADVFSIWKQPSSRNQLVLFSVFGMLGIQYTFVAAIEESNAVVATLLQFSAPIFVVLYVSLLHKKLPPGYQVIGIIGTLIGLFLLMTNGNFSNLLVSNKALLWGLALGITFAFYTLYPARLMKEWGVLIVVGWAMLCGGIVLGVINRVWSSNEWSIIVEPLVLSKLVILIIFGTMAFVLFLSSLKYISAVETSILSSVEPLTAMMISALWFGMMLQTVQLYGVLLMIIFVSWLSVGGILKKSKSHQTGVAKNSSG